MNETRYMINDLFSDNKEEWLTTRELYAMILSPSNIKKLDLANAVSYLAQKGKLDRRLRMCPKVVTEFKFNKRLLELSKHI